MFSSLPTVARLMASITIQAVKMAMTHPNWMIGKDAKLILGGKFKVVHSQEDTSA